MNIRLWLSFLVVCAILTVFSFFELDTYLSEHMTFLFAHRHTVEKRLAGSTLLTLEAVMFFGANIIGLIKGKMPRSGAAVAIACATSICAYAINARFLKVLFGVPNPQFFLKGVRHDAYWFSGSDLSSFPSGHMVLAASFVGVMLRYYPQSTRVLGGLLVIAAILLVMGNWHFLSDVIAGTFIGLSAGLVVGKYWATEPL